MNPFPNWARNILFLLVCILSGLALVIIINGLTTGTELTPFNTAVEHLVTPFRHGWLTKVMLFTTNLGSPTALLFFGILLAIYLLLNKDTYDALLYVVSILVSIISFIVLKNMFVIARPDQALTTLSTWSFPSGHATVATAFFFATAYSFWDHFKTFMSKITFVIFCIVSATLICFSRLYLGVHWALDVLAGVALGLLSVSFTLLIFNIFLEERTWWRRRRV
ncbi:phosphatase PAP2 family protein [Candidatus Parcubacteria bacterium]|nr:phosphatase PAP2 family protein [Candidatus Parcubacteria bacterium]